MTKTEALRITGCSVTTLAQEIGITPQAISLWPEELTPWQRDRVQALLYRRLMCAMATCPAPRESVTA